MNKSIFISVLSTAVCAPILCAPILCAPIVYAQDESSQTKSSTVIAVTRGQGDPSPIDVTIKINDGRVESAQLNGEDIPSDRIRRVADGFEILGADGAVLEHIAASHQDGAQSEAKAGTRTAIRINRDGAAAQALATQDARRAVVVQDIALAAAAESPKSMLGAGLGTVDAALAHHLGVDVAKSTLVTGVVDGLPAQLAGIEQFDVIVAVNGDADASTATLRAALKDLEPGAKITLGIRRGADTKSVELELVAYDAQQLSAIEGQSPAFAMVEGFEIPEMAEIEKIIALESAGEGGAGGAGGAGQTMFFIGPDGRKQQIVLPNISHNLGSGAWTTGGGPSLDAMQMLERRVMELTQRLEEQAHARGGRGSMNNGNSTFEFGAMNDDEMRDMDREMRDMSRDMNREMQRDMNQDMNHDMDRGTQPRRSAEPGAPMDRGHAMGEDRLARLEQQMERVLHELERVNAQPREGGDRGNQGAMREQRRGPQPPAPRGPEGSGTHAPAGDHADAASEDHIRALHPQIPSDLAGMNKAQLRAMLTELAVMKARRDLDPATRMHVDAQFQQVLEQLKTTP